MKQAVRRKYHYIYKITRIDGSDKFYIGMHSTDNLDDGYFGSGSLLSRSIKKHGQDKHVKEILEHLPTREALKLREKELVNEELLGDKRCMNLKLGGHGGFDHLNDGSDSHKERASRGGKIALSASWQNHQFRERQSMLKRERSKRLYSDSNFSKSARFSGKQHSDQTRKKMSVSNAGKQTGEKNSQFGSCWISNEILAIKVKKEHVETYLINGYVRGRKILRVCHLG